MRIHYLSGSRVPSTDANSVHVVKMCAAFASAGHEVTLFCRRMSAQPPNLPELYGVTECFDIAPVSHAAIPLTGAWLYSRQVAGRSRQMAAPDLYYARHIHTLAAIAAAGVPLIAECHAPPASVWQHRAFCKVIRCPAFRHVVAISAALREELLRRYPALAPERVLVAHDGADLQSAVTVPAELGGRNNAVQVGYTGHLYPGKGMEIIVRLAEVLPEMDFHIVGGTLADIAHWQARVSTVNVHFHGFVAHGRVPSYLAACNVLIAPYQKAVAVSGGKGDISRWMSPLKIFEYMASGKPIVASNLPVLLEVLTHERNALLCDPSDVSAWQAALQRIATTAQLSQRLAATAHADLAANHTWQARAKRVLE